VGRLTWGDRELAGADTGADPLAPLAGEQRVRYRWEPDTVGVDGLVSALRPAREPLKTTANQPIESKFTEGVQKPPGEKYGERH